MTKVQIRKIKVYGNSAPNLGRACDSKGPFTVQEMAIGIYPDGSFAITVLGKERMMPLLLNLPAGCRRALIQALRDEEPCTT